MRLLVVEDEPRLAENMLTALREGPRYAVDLARDGQEALLFCATRSYDGLVLDLMLPKKDGAAVLQRLRADGVTTPVLVLTAVDDRARVIQMLDLGADDYMTKPFDLGELIARVRALIRRSRGVAHPTLQFGSLSLHVAEQRIMVNGTAVEFSPTEHRILEYLLYRPRIVVSPRELLEHLFDFTWESHTNVVEVHISNIRKKLRQASASTTLENVRGRGYRLSDRRPEPAAAPCPEPHPNPSPDR